MTKTWWDYWKGCLQYTGLVSQAQPTSAKKGKVWWTAYTSRVPLHCTVQYNHIAVFCHMMDYVTVWVAIAVLKMAKESYRASLRYCRSCKTLELYFSGSMLTPQLVIQECRNLVTAHQTLLLQNWVRLVRLTLVMLNITYWWGILSFWHFPAILDLLNLLPGKQSFVKQCSPLSSTHN